VPIYEIFSRKKQRGGRGRERDASPSEK